MHSLREGSDSAIQRLLEDYAPAIEIYLRRRMANEANRESIDDIVQEVLLELFNKQDVLAKAQQGDKSRFRYLLMRVAYNAARNARRRIQRGNDRMVSIGDDTIMGLLEPDRDLNAEEQISMDRAWGLSIVEQAIIDCTGWCEKNQSDQEAVMALKLELEEKLNQRDIAQRLNLSLATAHRRLARGRMLIRKAMIDHLITMGECQAGGEDDALLRVWEAVTENTSKH